MDIDKSNGDFICMNKVDDKLLINNYLYSNGELNQIAYENSDKIYQYKIGPFVCRVDGTNKNENTEVLECSCDGVYWDYLTINKKMNVIQNISEAGEKLDSNPVYVKFDGNILGFETPPVIEDGSTLVPMRFLFEQMGADVEWNQETQTATATLNNTAVTFAIDDTEAEVNNTPATMDVPARLINGKTMVPLRFLSENLGYKVDWDETSRTAIIE